VRKSNLKEKVSKKRKSEYFILPLEIYHPMVLGKPLAHGIPYHI
jgi:hypothetical protein